MTGQTTQADGQTDRPTDGHTDRPTDRQTSQQDRRGGQHMELGIQKPPCSPRIRTLENLGCQDWPTDGADRQTDRQTGWNCFGTLL